MKKQRDLSLVAASMFTWGMGEGLFYIFQPLYIQELGADPILIGTILGINGIGMTLAQIPSGFISDHYGRRPLMWVTWFFGVIATVLMALAKGLPEFVAGLVLYGLTTAAIAPLNSYVTDARGNWSVGRAISFISACYNGGAIIGPLVGGAIATRFGLRMIYWAAAAVFLISTIIIFLIHDQPVKPKEEHEKSTDLLKNSRYIFSLVMILMIMLALYLPIPLTSNFLQNERQVSLTSIGQLGSIASVGTTVVLLVLGNLAPMKAFIYAELSMMVFALLVWKGKGISAYGIAYFLTGGYRLSGSLSVAFIRPLVREHQVGFAFGLLAAANNLAFIVGPVLAGLLYEKGPERVYWISIIILLVSLFLTYLVNNNRNIIKHWFKAVEKGDRV